MNLEEGKREGGKGAQEATISVRSLKAVHTPTIGY